jgi:ATP-dependent helicase HrpA
MSEAAEGAPTNRRRGGGPGPAAGADTLQRRLAEVTLRDEDRLRRRLSHVRRAARGDGGESALAKLTAEVEQAERRVARRRAAVPKLTYPPQLPVSARRDDLLEAIRDHQVVVVAGETGSGKTTQIPKLCLELGRGVRGAIAHTQPRRLAARTVAERIADELDVPLGEAVGYAVRFSDRSGEDTLVRLVTDGLLLAEIQRDRLLRRYDTIIVDEAHERSLNIDFLLGYLRQILPQRPDLKLIITSATIDPQRFSRHFGDAPVVEVSGRTYPVEVRYRPLTAGDDPDGEERDEVDAVGDAVDELLHEGPGDVLVFLSGEREIRDTADALRGRLRSDVEVLPLYARLSTSEQRRVFQPHRNRRVVLATNVAETSLTVPGIRYVVDPGNARISRYSARLKVQRLPIEPISQASADQRKGRCGRTSEGICIRLYDEQDFAERPRYTDPEILRTSLASVILQMAAVGLGDVEAFPFLDPPDARQVRDGLALLHELGAFDSSSGSKDPARRLTPLGRRLAQLPVDPRMARMVLEADRLRCADEVIVIAAALSIQDPRERPAEHQQAADQQHARFADESSDFLAYRNLWRYLREQQRELSSNQFRKRCRVEYLHYLRVREWQDLVGQLRQAAKGVDVTINREPAESREIHLALLSGLLSHVGMRDEKRRDYVGARNARFAIFPGSTLARKSPNWVMVAELVETSRLWGRTAAWIEPAWMEPLAKHLVKRSYDEPHWERRRASVVATERVTLYGLPIVAGRKVTYGRIDPVLSRSELIRRGLVEGDWQTNHAFLRENQRLLEQAEELEHRARRRGILVDDQVLYDFYDARIPADVVSGAHFDAWWKDMRRRDPDRLTFDPGLLVDPEAAESLDAGSWPPAWRQGGRELSLSYRFEPGREDDGVTVQVPLAQLGELDDRGFEWLVPGLRTELVTTLMRRLPKDLRRGLVPVPDVAGAILERLVPGGEPMVNALSREVERLRGVRVPPEAWDLAGLPPHLRMGFRVEDGRGEVLGAGKDLAALRERLRPRLRAELAAATQDLERHGLRQWTLGDLPRTVSLPGAGQAVRGYPSLVDEGDSVGVRVLDTADAQAASMRGGTRRLLELTVQSPVRKLQDGLGMRDQLTLSGAPHGSVRAVLDDVRSAAIDALLAAAGGPAWDAVGFAELRARVARGLPAVTDEVLRRVLRVLEARAEADQRREAVSGGAAPRLPGLRHGRRRAATAGHRALSQGCRAAARARGRRSGPGRRPHAHGQRARSGLPAASRRDARRPAAPRGAARGAVAARGAPGEPVRAGPRHARSRLHQADTQAVGEGGRRGLSDAPAVGLTRGSRGEDLVHAP